MKYRKKVEKGCEKLKRCREEPREDEILEKSGKGR